MLHVIIFLCSAAVADCNAQTATSRFTIVVESQTPMGCLITGYQELAKMSSFDPATQQARVSCGR